MANPERKRSTKAPDEATPFSRAVTATSGVRARTSGVITRGHERTGSRREGGALRLAADRDELDLEADRTAEAVARGGDEEREECVEETSQG